MADSKLITSIGEELECSICTDYFTDACFLACMHTFCRNCLRKCNKNHGRRGKTSMNCPICRKETILYKGVDGLQTDYTSNKLVTRLKEGIEERKRTAGSLDVGTMTCQSCQDGPIVAYCLSCCHFICVCCQSLHSKLSAMTTHEVVPLKDLHKGKVSIVRARNRFCSEHQLDTVCFCYSCQRYHCELCCILDSACHICSEPSHSPDARSAVALKKKVVAESVAKLSQKLTSIEKKKKKIKRLRASIKHHFGSIREQLMAHQKVRIDTITRIITENRNTLVQEIDDEEASLLSKLAGVDENLGHTESRALGAKVMGENAVNDGEHLEIAFIQGYLDDVSRSLDEDTSDSNITEIEQYEAGLTLEPPPSVNAIAPLASLGSFSRPDVWKENPVLDLSLDVIKAIHYDSKNAVFLAVSATNCMYSIDLDGAFCQNKLPGTSGAQDMALSHNGEKAFLLCQDNRIQILENQEWNCYKGLVSIPARGSADFMFSCITANAQDVVVVGDQTTQTIMGQSWANFKRMSDISPLRMAFTSRGDLVVVCRNISAKVHSNSGHGSSSVEKAGVGVKIFGMEEQRANVISQDKWQAAAVAAKHSETEEEGGMFFALGIYPGQDGVSLASLAEYDIMGERKVTFFTDKEVTIDWERGVQPLLAVDHAVSTLVVYTGAGGLRLFRKQRGP